MFLETLRKRVSSFLAVGRKGEWEVSTWIELEEQEGN